MASRVRLGQRSVSLQWAGDNSDAWQNLLRQHYGQSVACECTDPGQQLAIRRREIAIGGTVHEKYHLAIFPKTGDRHREICAFHRVAWNRSGIGSYPNGVVEELGDGKVRVRLRYSLSMEKEGNSASTGLQRAMSNLGLLHLLWERAGLCYWHGGKNGRGWRWAGDVIRGASEEILVQGLLSKAISLHKRLVIIQPEADDLRRASFESEVQHRLAKASKSKYQVVIVGELRAIDDYGDNHGRLKLVGSNYGIQIWIRDRSEVLQSYGSAVDSLRLTANSVPPRCIFIGVAEISPKGDGFRADMRGAALMPITATFLPFASGYELSVSSALEGSGRVFRKPLRYDAGASLVLPDFELLDTMNPVFPMEVFGMDTPGYRARMAEKQAFYDQNYGANQWWQWIVNTQKVMPPFPAPAK